ncbi:MAG: hypothetical protein CMC81_03030 [Flavobacteriaceae bacterium]|nr:hypothetical protein [Flavobacteriaceae bacterium]|tara:strand:+ start:35953 stop:36678 length:726 start_codon:yes stop_codon:yes gene_type:complete
MKKLFTLLLLTSFALQAQYYTITYIKVAPENVSNFERLEIDYWSKIASQNIENGKQLGWALMKKYGTAGNNEVNYAFINAHKNLSDLLNPGWMNSARKLGYNTQDISSDYQVYEMHHYKIQDQIIGNNDAKVWIWNYARPKNLEGFLSENKKIWKPLHKKNIMSKSNSMKNWGVGTKLYPVGQDESTVMTWDGFSSVEDALETLDLSDWVAPKGSKMDQYDPDGFRLRVIWEQIKYVGASE